MMEVNVNGLIRRLDAIEEKLRENDLLDEDDEMCIAILKAHLEEQEG